VASLPRACLNRHTIDSIQTTLVAGTPARHRTGEPNSHFWQSWKVMTIAPLTEERFDDFVGMIQGLAAYERLAGPDAAAAERLRRDAFGPSPRFEAALALDDSGKALGYAVWFETYSTFLGKPTMFLEDLFVREEGRGSGAGGMLFEHVRRLGAERGCGRMSWNVLDWNALARDFYHRRGGERAEDWLVYSLGYDAD
jgi:GNAT superfamily N-acetyltransferase